MVSSMEIEEKPYTFSEFFEKITKLEGYPPKALRVQCFLTKDDSWAPPGSIINLEYIFEKHRFKIQQLGEIRKLTCIYKDEETEQEFPITFFCHLQSKTKLLLCFCFTDAPGNVVDKIINSLAKEPGIYPLWIGPTAMEEIKKTIFSRFPYTKIMFFTAGRHEDSSYWGDMRPEFKRSIIYWGDDGAETLGEIKHYYGVFPRSMKFRIPDVGDFLISSQGGFTLSYGKKDFILELVNMTLKIVLRIREAIEKSHLSLVSIQMANKELKVPTLVPWIINFSRELKPADGEVLLNLIQKNRFSLCNPILMHGSILLDSTVVDEVKKSAFSINANSTQMVIAPHHDTPFDSFVRFLQVIVENIDPEAMCVTGIES